MKHQQLLNFDTSDIHAYIRLYMVYTHSSHANMDIAMHIIAKMFVSYIHILNTFYTQFKHIIYIYQIRYIAIQAIIWTLIVMKFLVLIMELQEHVK